jgi:hypothetical protein
MYTVTCSAQLQSQYDGIELSDTVLCVALCDDHKQVKKIHLSQRGASIMNDAKVTAKYITCVLRYAYATCHHKHAVLLTSAYIDLAAHGDSQM